MVEKLKRTLLIEECVIFPDSLRVESEPYSSSMADRIGLNAPRQAIASNPQRRTQMITIHNLTIVIFCSVLLTSLTHAQDLSRYRDFQFGMNLPTVAKQADLKQSDARAVHQRPAIIEELEWRPQSFLTTSPRPQGDPVKDVLFSFYNGELFRMVVNYDPDKTQGLTNDDMVGAISATWTADLLRRRSVSRRPRVTARPKRLWHAGKTRSTRSTSSAPLTSLTLEWWCFRSDWMLWRGWRWSKRSGGTNRKLPNEKLTV